jgi:hypothetical protein
MSEIVEEEMDGGERGVAMSQRRSNGVRGGGSKEVMK